MDETIPSSVPNAAAWKYIQEHLFPSFVAFSITAWKPISPGAAGNDLSSGMSSDIYSGFLLVHRGCWLFVTSGHIIKNLDAAEAGGCKLTTACFCDGFAKFDGPMDRLPISYDRHRWGVFCDTESGVDIAVLPLRRYEVQNLYNNGCRPISSDSCARTFDGFDFCALLGIPSELKRMDPYRCGGEIRVAVEVSVPMLPLEPFDENHEYAKPVARPGIRFVGKLTSMNGVDAEGKPLHLRSIVGMSGGPVFGFNYENGGSHVRCKIIGVQSEWNERRHVVGVNRLDTFLDYLDEYVLDMHAEQVQPATSDMA